MKKNTTLSVSLLAAFAYEDARAASLDMGLPEREAHEDGVARHFAASTAATYLARKGKLNQRVKTVLTLCNRAVATLGGTSACDLPPLDVTSI